VYSRTRIVHEGLRLYQQNVILPNLAVTGKRDAFIPRDSNEMALAQLLYDPKTQVVRRILVSHARIPQPHYTKISRTRSPGRRDLGFDTLRQN
jgi:hypothetical protein